ncbi:MAG: response regulator, partial [Planctomycetes bacterium]|nr:response regulator [Planctomycetota bacterium]
MAKIRILVVDDSVVVRRLLAKVLASDPALEVSATAANGRIALAMLPQVHPDLVLLDVVMDQMDGLETLTELRKTYPRLPVLMFSTYTERGAAQTLEAIARGATDYVTKPTTLSGQDGGLNALKDQLIPKIKELCRVREGMGAEALPRPRLDKGGALPRPVEILVIGTSTGGPNALTELLTPLPGDFPVPIAIVQHMPPLFTRSLADRLASRCQIAVEEGVAGGAVRPGHAWVAPGNYHMTLVPDGETVRLGLNQDP